MPPKASAPQYLALSAISFSDAEGHLDLASGDEVPTGRFTEEDIARLLDSGAIEAA